MPSRKPPAPPDPDRLVRQQAGTYRTPDERFEVREADVGWFIVDLDLTDDLGQPLVRGPFPTLKAVGAAIPAARSGTPTPRGRPRPVRATRGTPKQSQPPKSSELPKPPGSPRSPAPPPSWIDKLSATDASAVRRLIKALEAEGVERAEALVRRDREGLEPVVAAALIRDGLDALLRDATDAERALANSVVKLLTEDGHGARLGLPGWSLVETGAQPAQPNRRIRVALD